MIAKDIIAQMPDDVRSIAESRAVAAGLSLEDYVQNQVATQLSDEELDAVAGGVETTLVIRLDQGPGGTTGGVGATFKFKRQSGN